MHECVPARFQECGRGVRRLVFCGQEVVGAVGDGGVDVVGVSGGSSTMILYSLFLHTLISKDNYLVLIP